MISNFLTRYWLQIMSLMMVEMQRQELRWLIEPSGHISILSSRRTMMIASRLQIVAGLFAVLTPLYIVVEIAILPREIWVNLAIARLLATVAFVIILLEARRADTIGKVYCTLGTMIAVAIAFFLYTHVFLDKFHLEGLQAAFSTGYALLPFVMLASLSIFPLAIIESVAFSIPLLFAELAGFYLSNSAHSITAMVASFWLMILICGASVLAGMSQLGFIIVLVRESMRDSLTGCFSRNSGEELLDLQFILSCRSGAPLALAFVDLDHFKSINDKYGHDAGDRSLIDAANSMRAQLRSSDMLSRWGGEEFVLIMPGADAEHAHSALERFCQPGLCKRPDGTPLTASIGISERQRDKTPDWQGLVEIADNRMYAAKRAGRNRIVSNSS